jgi:HK97 family phage prohead protease
MPEYKRMLIDAPDVKVLNDDAGEITGYASTFGNFDDVGERVVKGAFTRHLAAFVKDGFVAIGHNWGTLPIASPAEAYEDEHGLFVRAAFHSIPAAQDARTVIRERLERNKSVKLSIGYEVLADEYTEEGRLLKDVRLFEWSYVTVPANSQAAVTGVKGVVWKDQPLTAHASAVEAAIAELAERVSDLKERREKAGRVFSASNYSALETVAGEQERLAKELRALLASAEPKHRELNSYADTNALRAQWARQQERLRALGVY